MKAKRKLLTLVVEYTDPHEVKNVLSRVSLAMNAGVSSTDRVITDEVSYEWSVDYLEYTDYREELINGVWCMVIPSKMNKL